jgi:hypothetical protein
MRPISKTVKEALLERPDKCERFEMFHDHICKGRITWEHAIVYAGRQVDESWAIIKICAWAHDVDQFQDGHNLNKEKNEYIALFNMHQDALEKYPRNNWLQRLKYLHDKYNPQRTNPIKEK